MIRSTIHGILRIRAYNGTGHGGSSFSDRHQKENSMKQIQASLGVAIILLVVLFPGCGSPGDEAPGQETSAPALEPLTDEETTRALTLFEENACVDCHGEDRKGSEAAPSLFGIRAHWTEAKLMKYFYNPEFYMVSDPTVLARNPGYEITMPPFLDMSEEDRSLLARWVLEESE
jgi:cytochrome c551/c552